MILALTLLSSVSFSIGFKSSKAPIRVIDIFTNYPNTNEVIKEYTEIQQKRSGEERASARSWRDYDYYDHRYRRPYDSHHHSDYFDRRNYYDGDILESEFGIFDDDKHHEPDRYVYVNYANTRKPNVPHVVTTNAPPYFQNFANDQNSNSFNDKLDQFVAETIKSNTTRYPEDQFHLGSNEIYMQSDYGDIVKPTKKFKPYKAPAISNHKVAAGNATRQRITNILRKYLVRMHKKSGGKNSKQTHHDRTLAQIFDSPRNTEFVTDYKLHEGQQKFLTYPLEHIKNKTIKFANKFLSLFTVVQFPNFKCQATSALSNYEGTCFLASECSARFGTAMGLCAEGHGVCCVFKGTCGGVGSNNCTYFESPGYPNYFPESGGIVTPGPTQSPITTTTPNPLTPDPRLQFLEREGRQNSNDQANALSCIFNVYKSDVGIRQMRIDFIDLELKGPTNGNCVDERLVISGVNLNTAVPVICGYNTGQHVYVDVSDLSGPLQISVLANTIERKRYKLRICQYSDGCSGLMNCLQYYTGVSGVITSFNYEQAATFSRSTPQYLNNLNYAICIRREPGYCTITYSTVSNGATYPFQLSNFDDGVQTVPSGQAGAGVINCPDDYIVINGIRLCGDRLNDGSVQENFSLNAPVTDFSGGPIIIPVRTSASINGRGFKLFYTQNRCGANVGGNGNLNNGLRPDPRY